MTGLYTLSIEGMQSGHFVPMTANNAHTSKQVSSIQNYSRFLLLIAGLGGLLYGIDVGIIVGGALRAYLEATSNLNGEKASSPSSSGGRAPRQRLLYVVRGFARRLAMPDAPTASTFMFFSARQRNGLRSQHSGDRAIPELRSALLRPPASGCESAVNNLGLLVRSSTRTALPGRMPLCG